MLPTKNKLCGSTGARRVGSPHLVSMKELVLRVLLFFVIAQFLGFFTGLVLINDIDINPVARTFSTVSEPNDPLSSIYFFCYTLAGAAFIIILIRYVRSDIIFAVLEFGLISTASSLVFYSFARLFLPYFESMAIAIALGLVFAGLKLFFMGLKNSATILSSAGAGALIGVSLGVLPAFIFLILLAVYDYVAVFKTRHMVELAGYMMKKNLSFTVTSRVYVPEMKKERRLDLGSGDLIMPIVVEVAVLPLGSLASLFVFMGALISLGTFLFLVIEKRMVLPAMPPIAAGIMVFFLIGRLFGLY